MGIPLVDLTADHAGLEDELREGFDRVLARGQFIDGEEVARFEAALAARVGVRAAVGVGSGTAALFLTLRAAGIGLGDEVVLQANTFFATAEAVLATGAAAVLVDVDARSGSVDPKCVATAITPRTAAVIAVHLYGHPADVGALRAITEHHGLLLIEDAAQAMGATVDGHAAGSLGAAGAFSFYPSKILGALGDAGAVTTNDETLAARVRLLRSHGEFSKNHHVLVGHNERLDELQAALLSTKLQHLDHALERRLQLVERYDEQLRGFEQVERVLPSSGGTSVHHLFVITVPRRDAVLADLRRQGIGAGVHYPTPIHLQPACSDLDVVVAERELPNAEALSRCVLSLPLYPAMTEDQVDIVVGALGRALESL